MLVEINVVIVGLAGWYYQDGDLPQLVTVDKSKSPMFLSLSGNSYRVIEAFVSHPPRPLLIEI